MNQFSVDDEGFLSEDDARDVARRVEETLPWVDTLALEASIMVARAFQAHLRTVEHVKAEFGLSGARFDLLRVLYHADDGPLMMNEIAKRLLVTPTNVTKLVEALVKDGLVQRKAQVQDRRAVYVELTPEGRRLYETARPDRVKQTQDEWKGLSDREKRLLIHLLTKFRMTMAARPDDAEVLQPTDGVARQ